MDLGAASADRPGDASAELSEEGLVPRLRAAGCVFAEDEARLLVAEAQTQDELRDRVARRVAGEPLEHVLGWAELCGVRVLLDRAVFVPRRRTELLVRAAAELTRPGSVVVDLCCGSGAVGLALAAAVDGLELHAADVDAAAVACARRNVLPVGGHVHEGDLYDALPPSLQGRVDVLVVNAPYVPTDAVALMPPEARLHEPRTALDGGRDGLDLHRRVAADAGRWLAPGGHLLLETSRHQAGRTADALARAGLDVRVVTDDRVDGTLVTAAFALARRA